jgi:hypothetical protein
MYSIINSVDNILQKSIKYINKHDRVIYKKFFTIIEKYIIDNHLIIGGNFANMVLLNADTDREMDYSLYEIYSEEPEDDAIKLSNLLYKEDENGISRYSYVFPFIANNIYYIYVNGRQLCILKNMPIYKGVQIESLIVSQYVNSIYENKKMLCMGNYIQLINLYNEINNLDFIQKLQDNIILEKKIRDLYLKSVKNSDIIFHKDEDANFHKEMDVNFHKEVKLKQMELKSEQIEFIKKNNISFIYTYLNNSNRVIIGDIGMYILLNKNKKINYNEIKKFRLQILTTNKLEDEGKLLNILGKKYNMDIQWTISFPKYIDDFYLKRLTAYIMIDGCKKTILDMFNYGEYSLIGYNTIKIDGIQSLNGVKSEKNIKYGSIFILMRFRLIEEWIINLLYELKSIDKVYAKSMIKNVRAGFISLSNHINDYLSTESSMIAYFNNLEYIGTYKDIILELKRKSAQLRKNTIVNTYYPLKHFTKK